VCERSSSARLLSGKEGDLENDESLPDCAGSHHVPAQSVDVID